MKPYEDDSDATDMAPLPEPACGGPVIMHEGGEGCADCREHAICGCREYPEYGNACLLPKGHSGPHDW
jgi:hypothetical protein